MPSSFFAPFLQQAERTLTLPYDQWPSYYEDTISSIDTYLDSGCLSEEDAATLGDMKRRLLEKKAKDTAPTIMGFATGQG